ncbi:MAG: serpin family protein [Lentisphaeria bacterium]|nr:serpin family protein [Lentisphaeria bacterium]
MKKTSFSNVSRFIFRKIGRLGIAACAAATVLSALPLHAADAPADQKAIAAKMNRKGFELFRHLSEEDTKENAFISPYSINSAFGLVYCGAKERTAQEIRDTLGLPDDPADCGEFFHAVSQEYAANKLVEVLVSNSVWYEQKYEKAILPSFVAMIDKYYDGTFYKEDFKKPDPLVAKVNAYVEDHTKNMIKDLLSISDISEKTFMILLNTLYFEAKWRTPFKKDETKPMIFRNFDGKDKRVKMMYRRGFDIGYYSNEADNVHAVVLPYEDSRFELVALMPIQAGADQGEAAMKSIISKIGDRLDSWLSNKSPYETRLWLPVTDLTSRYDLKKALKELGMPTPFNVTQANFHGIAEPPKNRPATDEDLIYIWIEKVIHKTALKMDEETTKAAAATAIIMGGFGTGINTQPPPVNIFRADRPFLVLIRDNKTGLILFAGRINDPGVEATEADGPVTPSFGMPGMPGMPGTQRQNSLFGPSLRNFVPGTTPSQQPRTNRPAPSSIRTQQPAAAGQDQSTATRTQPTEQEQLQLKEPAEPVVDGKALAVIECNIDGEDEFIFRDGKIILKHKEYKMPTGVTVNGEAWTNLEEPFDLGFTPAPATARFACEGRGQTWLVRSDDSLAITVYDYESSDAHHKITVFRPAEAKASGAAPKAADLNGADASFEGKVNGEITVVLQMSITGEEAFIFRDGKIFFEHKSGIKARNVKVNGKRWNLSEPFDLGFTPAPDETRYAWTEQRSGNWNPRGDIKMTGEGGGFRLSIKEDVGITHDLQIVLFHSPGSKFSSEKTAPPPKTETKEKTVAAQPPGMSGISIRIGEIESKSVFFFSGNTIVYQHEDGKFPAGVTINGMPWDDLTKTFVMENDVDFSSVALSEKLGRGNVSLLRNKDGRGAVTIDAMSPSATIGTDSRLRLTISAILKPHTGPAKEQPAYQSHVILNGQFAGKEVFTFRGDTVTLRHEDGKDPVDVAINGRAWKNLNVPFELGYQPVFDPKKGLSSSNVLSAQVIPRDDGGTDVVVDARTGGSTPREKQISIPVEKRPYTGGTETAAEAAAQAVEPGAIVMEGKLDGECTFIFRKDTVSYRNRGFGKPSGVKINGVAWTNLAVPFKLNGASRFVPARIRALDAQNITAVLNADEDKAELNLDGNARSRGGIYRIELAGPRTNTKGGAVVIEGVFNGIGSFEFNGSRISYHHVAFETPKDVTVNGRAWQVTGGRGVYWTSSNGSDSNPDFDLDFIPDYQSLNLAEQPDLQEISLAKGYKGMELHFRNLKQDPKPVRIRLDANAKPAPAAPSGDRAELTIESRGGAGSFSFRKNMIVYNPANRGQRFYPQTVTVNDKNWTDLNLPFKLDFLPGFSTAEVLEATCPGFVRTEKRADDLELVFDSTAVFNAPLTRFIVNLEKKPGPAPDTRYTATILTEFRGAAAFKFEGSRVFYYPLCDEPAKSITVNGKPWTDLNKPFELGFEVAPLRAQLLDRFGNCTVEQMKYPDSYVLRLENNGSDPCEVVAELNGDASAAASAAASGAQDTVSIGMKLNGAGRLTFRGNRIYYKLFEMNPPSEVTVNGEPWTDLDRPFELDFVPEFSTAKIASVKSGGTMELTPGEDRAELYLNANGMFRTYQFDIAMKKRKDAEPGSAPADEPKTETEALGNGIGYASAAGIGPFGPATKPVDPDSEAVFEVTSDKPCVFTFQDDMIHCSVPEVPTPRPMDYNGPMITINGRMVEDLGQPIILNFIPDIEHADVTVSFERRSQLTRLADNPVLIRRDGKRMELRTMDMSRNSNGTYSVKVEMKKLADSKHDPNSGERLTLNDPKRLMPAGQAQEWGATMQMIFDAMEGGPLRSIDFDAEIAGTGVFEFFGDRISYRHESGGRPAGVKVGGKAWDDLDVPFELPFMVNHSHETLSYRYAANSPAANYPYKPVSLVGDRGRHYLSTREIAASEGGTPGTYHLHYVMTELNPRMGRGRFRISTPTPEQLAREASTAALETKTVALEGVIDGNVTFMVEGNTIRLEAVTGMEPTHMSVNGKPWTDVGEPFELDFTPEYSAKAKSIESRGRGNTIVSPLAKGVEIRVMDSDPCADLYRIVFSLKKKPDGK